MIPANLPYISTKAACVKSHFFSFLSVPLQSVWKSPRSSLALSEAEELMRLCEPGIIDKTRYLVRSGKHVFEVDEFYGENEGLIVAEVELESEDEAFVKPDFIGEEVTGDIRYYNSQLMKKPYKTW